MASATRSVGVHRATIDLARADLAARLRDRRREIEQAMMTRVNAVAAIKDLDPGYAEGLRAAVGVAIDYEVAAVELGEERSPPPPPALLAQARMAARNGVSLDTVLRRCFAGHALLADFLIEEAEHIVVQGAPLQRLLRTQTTLFDRVIVAIVEEHTSESARRLPSVKQRHADRIHGLLAGELLDVSDLQYDFHGCHIGVIAQGPGAEEAIRGLASALDRRLLAIPHDKSQVWAWLGGRRPLDPADLQAVDVSTWHGQASIAIGEPAVGLTGWRLTHRQARAALPVALRSQDVVIRYADVAVLASILQDDLLATSLRELYLRPLETERDGGDTFRQTLRAYFAAGRNISSAAAALGVNRHTVTSRLRALEVKLRRPLVACEAELENALRLESLSEFDPPS